VTFLLWIVKGPFLQTIVLFLSDLVWFRFPLSFVSFLYFVLTNTILFFLKTGASKLLLCMTLLKVGLITETVAVLFIQCDYMIS
jgi:hypothetical protein